MSIWVIVPVKPFDLAKSRLASVMRPAKRATLSKALLAKTLGVLRVAPSVARMVVVSRDPAALALARQYDATTVTEAGHPELNGAVRRAIMAVRALGAASVLVLPADLPQLEPADIEILVAAAGYQPQAVVIAPDRHGRGTNALLLHPAEVIDVAFGPDSFRDHVRRSEARGVPVTVVERAGLALDLDTPDDWALVRDQLEDSVLG
jgi:2-phospho-L-lactate guanylyltransferase